MRLVDASWMVLVKTRRWKMKEIIQDGVNNRIQCQIGVGSQLDKELDGANVVVDARRRRMLKYVTIIYCK